MFFNIFLSPFLSTVCDEIFWLWMLIFNMSPLFHFVIFSVITLSVSNDLLNYLEESEIEVMVSIFSRLRIGHGFFVTEFLNPRIFTNIKSIVHRHKIFVSQMGIDHFENYFFSKAGPSHTKIAIFTKGTEINILENAFESVSNDRWLTHNRCIRAIKILR